MRCRAPASSMSSCSSSEYEINCYCRHHQRCRETRLYVQQEALAFARHNTVDLHLQCGRTAEVPAYANAVGGLIVAHVQAINEARQALHGCCTTSSCACRARRWNGVAGEIHTFGLCMIVVRQEFTD